MKAGLSSRARNGDLPRRGKSGYLLLSRACSRAIPRSSCLLLVAIDALSIRAAAKPLAGRRLPRLGPRAPTAFVRPPYLLGSPRRCGGRSFLLLQCLAISGPCFPIPFARRPLRLPHCRDARRRSARAIAHLPGSLLAVKLRRAPWPRYPKPFPVPAGPAPGQPGFLTPPLTMRADGRASLLCPRRFSRGGVPPHPRGVPPRRKLCVVPQLSGTEHETSRGMLPGGKNILWPTPGGGRATAVRFLQYAMHLVLGAFANFSTRGLGTWAWTFLIIGAIVSYADIVSSMSFARVLCPEPTCPAPPRVPRPGPSLANIPLLFTGLIARGHDVDVRHGQACLLRATATRNPMPVNRRGILASATSRTGYPW